METGFLHKAEFVGYPQDVPAVRIEAAGDVAGGHADDTDGQVSDMDLQLINDALYGGYSPGCAYSELWIWKWDLLMARRASVYGASLDMFAYHRYHDARVAEMLLADAVRTGRWNALPKSLQAEYHRRTGGGMEREAKACSDCVPSFPQPDSWNDRQRGEMKLRERAYAEQDVSGWEAYASVHGEDSIIGYAMARSGEVRFDPEAKAVNALVHTGSYGGVSDEADRLRLDGLRDIRLRELCGVNYDRFADREPYDEDISELLLADAFRTGRWLELPDDLQKAYCMRRYAWRDGLPETPARVGPWDEHIVRDAGEERAMSRFCDSHRYPCCDRRFGELLLAKALRDGTDDGLPEELKAEYARQSGLVRNNPVRDGGVRFGRRGTVRGRLRNLFRRFAGSSGRKAGP